MSQKHLGSVKHSKTRGHENRTRLFCHLRNENGLSLYPACIQHFRAFFVTLHDSRKQIRTMKKQRRQNDVQSKLRPLKDLYTFNWNGDNWKILTFKKFICISWWHIFQHVWCLLVFAQWSLFELKNYFCACAKNDLLPYLLKSQMTEQLRV